MSSRNERRSSGHYILSCMCIHRTEEQRGPNVATNNLSILIIDCEPKCSFHNHIMNLSLLVRFVHLHSSLDLLNAIAQIIESVFVLLQYFYGTGIVTNSALSFSFHSGSSFFFAFKRSISFIFHPCYTWRFARHPFLSHLEMQT